MASGILKVWMLKGSTGLGSFGGGTANDLRNMDFWTSLVGGFLGIVLLIRAAVIYAAKRRQRTKL